MHLPYYRGFFFAIAKNPTTKTIWNSCKEYAGSALGCKNPKRYTTVTIWNGYKDGGFNEARRPINGKAKELEEHLNSLSVEFGSKDKFIVLPIKDYKGCLHIRVPPAWCHNRITAHLFATHVRLFLMGTTQDKNHLEASKDLLTYGKEVGLDIFNKKMYNLNKFRRVLGIVAAEHRWKLAQNETN